ncbi:MAG: NTP/NDP exchange transporter [Candidatus Omnitrophota bacterium]
MTRFLHSLFKPFFDIRPGERRRTALMFLYFMLVITTIYILKPLRNALFIDDFGADKMKYINVGEGFFLIAVVSVYTWIAKRLPHRLFDLMVTVFLIFNLAFFWIFSQKASAFISAFFFLWQATFSVVLTTQFWIFANDLFAPGEAKRCFGLIISGGSVGGILGGTLTNVLVQITDPHNLFLVVSFILGLCILISTVLWKDVHKARQAPPATFTPAEEKHHKKIEPSKVMSYLILVTGLVVLAKMSSTIVENQFAGVVEKMVTGKQALAAFYGGFYAWLNFISFLMQLIMTALVLRRVGALGAVWILPIGLAVLSAWNLCVVSLVAAVIYRLYDGSMNYSIQQASKEILYLPLTSETRWRAKPWIDMVGFRGAKSLAGFLMIGASSLFGLSAHQMGALVLALMPVWIAVLILLRRRVEAI